MVVPCCKDSQVEDSESSCRQQCGQKIMVLKVPLSLAPALKDPRVLLAVKSSEQASLSM